jgi:hypothetical protein
MLSPEEITQIAHQAYTQLNPQDIEFTPESWVGAAIQLAYQKGLDEDIARMIEVRDSRIDELIKQVNHLSHSHSPLYTVSRKAHITNEVVYLSPAGFWSPKDQAGQFDFDLATKHARRLRGVVEPVTPAQPSATHHQPEIPDANRL